MQTASEQRPLPRRAKARSPLRAVSLPHVQQSLAILLFLFSLALLAVSSARLLRTVRPPVQKVAARGAVDVFALARTPTFAAGRLRYMILGLGQDEVTGRQIVWIRSITSNRIGGFGKGEAVFGSPVTLRSISPAHVELEYAGDVSRVVISP